MLHATSLQMGLQIFREIIKKKNITNLFLEKERFAVEQESNLPLKKTEFTKVEMINLQQVHLHLIPAR